MARAAPTADKGRRQSVTAGHCRAARGRKPLRTRAAAAAGRTEPPSNPGRFNLPFDPTAASLFFQLSAFRYETDSLVVSFNLAFSRWGEALGDYVIAAAKIDRLVPPRPRHPLGR